MPPRPQYSSSLRSRARPPEKALIAIDTLPMAFAQVNINKHEGDGEPALVDHNATAIKVFYFVGEKDNT